MFKWFPFFLSCVSILILIHHPVYYAIIWYLPFHFRACHVFWLFMFQHVVVVAIGFRYVGWREEGGRKEGRVYPWERVTLIGEA